MWFQDHQSVSKPPLTRTVSCEKFSRLNTFDLLEVVICLTFIRGCRHNESMQISAEYRTQIERRILEVLAKGLEQKQLTAEDSTSVAQFILDHLDHVQNHQQLIQFLDSLAKRWPIFVEIGNIELAKAIEGNKEAVTIKMEQLVHQGNIQGALDTAQILKPH